MSRADRAVTSAIDQDIVVAQQALAGLVVPSDPLVQSPQELRRNAEISAALWADGLPEIAHVEDLNIPGPGGALRARWFDPRVEESGHAPAIFFLHGGGWTIGSVDTHDRLMRCLAAATGWPVLGIDFRLAPEHPFPAALDDCLAAFAWLSGRAGQLVVDPARIALVGDSSGGNLALATAISLRDGRKLPPPMALALLYPCLSPSMDSESHRVNGDGRFGLTTERLSWYWRNYWPDQTGVPPTLVAPLGARLEGLPPVYACLAELDPLADDACELADCLATADVAFKLDCWPGAVHGFMQMTRDVPLARQAVTAAAEFLRLNSRTVTAELPGL
jgi:acetyl esterase